MALAVEPPRLIEQSQDRSRIRVQGRGRLVCATALERFWRLFRLSVWRAFEHDAFAIAKASAYSSILTFFPALLVLGSVMATVRPGDVFLREFYYALGFIRPSG